MAGGGGGGNGDPEFQIAPMIDVLLVLLIFFMSITSTQVLKVDKDIVLPISKNANKRDDTRNEAIINVKWDATKKEAIYTYDDITYDDLSLLTKKLEEVKAISANTPQKGNNPDFRVLIRADREGEARSVGLVMNAAAEAGIADISFSTSNKD